MAQERIFQVEDESIVAMDVTQRLSDLGYEMVGYAKSGHEALEKIRQCAPDLVLMDILLEGDMDGIQTAQQIRARFDIPVIYITAQADAATLERARITDPYGYIIKPFNEKELHSTIETALLHRRWRRG